jgi:hypothetical protein
MQSTAKKGRVAVGGTLAAGARARTTLAYWQACKYRRHSGEAQWLAPGSGVWVAFVGKDGKPAFRAGHVASINELAKCYVIVWEGQEHVGQFVNAARVTPRYVGEIEPGMTGGAP